MSALKISGVCRKAFTLPPPPVEGLWLAPWLARCPPRPGGCLRRGPRRRGRLLAAARSRTGRGSSGRVLRAGGTGGTRCSRGWGWRVRPPPRPARGPAPLAAAGRDHAPAQRRGDRLRAGWPLARSGGCGGHTAGTPMRRAPQRCLRWQAGGTWRGEAARGPAAGRGSWAGLAGAAARSGAAAPGRALNPGLPGAAACVRLAPGTGPLAPAGLPRLGLLPSGRRGRAGAVPPCPISPRRSPASPSPGAAVGPTGLCLCLTQRRASPPPPPPALGAAGPVCAPLPGRGGPAPTPTRAAPAGCAPSSPAGGPRLLGQLCPPYGHPRQPMGRRGGAGGERPLAAGGGGAGT